MGNGPTKIVKYTCRGCTHCRSDEYFVEDGNDVDSGALVRCAHPGAKDGGRVGDTTWKTPDWCPEWGNAKEAGNGNA